MSPSYLTRSQGAAVPLALPLTRCRTALRAGAPNVDDGVIAGRSRKEDLIAAFRLIGFCEGDTNYSVMTNFLSTGLDVLADHQTSR